MIRLRYAGWVPVSAAVTVALGACGGKSDEDVRADRQADVVLDAAQPIAKHVELADSSAARHAAERLRRAYAGLCDAAGKAQLRRCGRGGNRAADTVLFTVYSSEYITVNSDLSLRLGSINKHPKTFQGYRRYLRGTLKLVTNYRTRIGRLAPPKLVRRRHRLMQRRTTRALTSGRRLLAIVNRGQGALAAGNAQALALRVQRQGDLADVAERAVRRILRAPGSRRPAPSSRTDST